MTKMKKINQMCNYTRAALVQCAQRFREYLVGLLI